MSHMFVDSGGDFCWRLGDERGRREDRGTEGAEGVGCGDAVSPSPLVEGSGQGAVPPSRIICRFVGSKGECYFCS